MGKEGEPGRGKSCPDCVRRVSEPDFYSGAYCREVRLGHDGKPITADLTGDRFTCNGFDPNLATSLRGLVAEARLLVNSVGSVLPPV